MGGHVCEAFPRQNKIMRETTIKLIDEIPRNYVDALAEERNSKQ